MSISGHLTINLHHFQLINQKFLLFFFGKEWSFLSLIIKITRSFDKHFFRFFFKITRSLYYFFFSDTIFQKWSKVVKVMVFLKLCTKICKCTERCARVDFPPTGSKWRSCGSTPLKTIVFEAIVNYVLLHRTSWLRMRAWGPAVVLLGPAKARAPPIGRQCGSQIFQEFWKLYNCRRFKWRSAAIGRNAPFVVTCRDHCSLSRFSIGAAVRSHFLDGCRDMS